MSAFVDRTGEQFGRLTVIERAENRGGHVFWRCVCECGGETFVTTGNLRGGSVKSCGCLWRETSEANRAAIIVARERQRQGRSPRRSDPTYKSWRSMKQRCLNPRSDAFADYGGRGITVDARWRDSYESFLADLGDRPEGCSLDRIDVDGPYEPGNCRWATAAEQVANIRPKLRLDQLLQAAAPEDRPAVERGFRAALEAAA